MRGRPRLGDVRRGLGAVQPDVSMLLRALLTGWLVVALGASAHHFGGCQIPGPLTLGVTGLVVTLAALPNVRRTPSVRRLGAVLVAGQAGLHLLFTVAAPDRDHEWVTSAAMTEMNDSVGGGLASLLSSVTAAAADMLRQGPLLATHMAAALVLAWWICRGERDLAHVVELGAQRLIGASELWQLPGRTPVHADVVVVYAAAGITGGQRLSRTVLQRRGPPICALAA